MILEPNEEAVRYYLVYATNHPRGVEVFKAAENKAARIQDNVRQESRVKKAGGQLEFPSEDGPPKSRLILDARTVQESARNKVIDVLASEYFWRRRKLLRLVLRSDGVSSSDS